MIRPWTARKGKKPRDWAAWFDGKYREIRRGRDFACKATSMLVQLRMRAPEYGGGITGNVSDVDPDLVCFRFVSDEEREREKQKKRRSKRGQSR